MKLSKMFIIEGRLDGLNEYTRMCRTNRFGANALKQKNEKKVIVGAIESQIDRVKSYPVQLKIKWYEPNARRDIDNICMATKFILDALVKIDVLKNDNQKHVNKIIHDVYVDRDYPRIEVEIVEEEQDGR